MVEGTPVTCPSCKLKYFARAGGACPRCNTEAPAPARAAAPAPAPVAAGVSTSRQDDRRPVRPLIWIGVCILVVGGAAAAWSRWGRSDEPAADTPTAVDCFRVSGIAKRRNAGFEVLADAPRKRSNAMNLLMTTTDIAKEIDGTANDFDAVSFQDPAVKSAAGDLAAALRRMAEHIRLATVAARTGDAQQVGKQKEKLEQSSHEAQQSWKRLETLCALH